MTRLRTVDLVLVFTLAGSHGCRASEPDPAPAASETPPEVTAPEPAPLEFASDSKPFEAALAKIDADIVATNVRAEANPSGWLVLERVAGLYLVRARLSGDYDDYTRAEAALTDAFARAPEGAGPIMTRAQLNLAMHRVDRVEADLNLAADAILIDQPTRARIIGVRGDLALQRGEYEQANALIGEALELDRNVTTLSRKALWLWQTGEYEQAEAHYREALGMVIGDAPDVRAWIHLQLGLLDLDRGRYDDAFAHYRDGTVLLSGWWLLEEHIAEICVLTGRVSQAEPLYQAIVARTDKGEFMDALAELARARGEQPEAQKWIERGAAKFEAQLVAWPEASYGHALDHFLTFGPPARALELAEANHRLRPNVEAKRDLAAARLALDDVAGAQAVIAEALATPVERADVFALAAEIAERSGDAAEAKRLHAEAAAIDPTGSEP